MFPKNLLFALGKPYKHKNSRAYSRLCSYSYTIFTYFQRWFSFNSLSFPVFSLKSHSIATRNIDTHVNTIDDTYLKTRHLRRSFVSTFQRIIKKNIEQLRDLQNNRTSLKQRLFSLHYFHPSLHTLSHETRRGHCD